MLINLEDTEIWKLTNGTLDNHVTCEIDDRPYEELACLNPDDFVLVSREDEQLKVTRKYTCWQPLCPWYTSPYHRNMDSALLTSKQSYYIKTSGCSRRNHTLVKLRKLEASYTIDFEVVCKAGAVVEKKLSRYTRWAQAPSFSNYVWSLRDVVMSHLDTDEAVDRVFELLATTYWKERQENKRLAVSSMLTDRWSQHAPEIQVDRLAELGLLQQDGVVVDMTEDQCCGTAPLAGFLVTRQWLGLFSIAELRSGHFKLKKQFHGLTKKAISEKAKAYTCIADWPPEQAFVNLVGVRVFARTPETVAEQCKHV